VRTRHLKPYSADEFWATLAVIERSGVAETITAKLASTHKGGRKSNLSVLVLLTAMALTAINGHIGLLIEIFHTMTEHWPKEVQVAAGIRSRNGKLLISYHSVTRLVARIKKVYNWKDIDDADISAKLEDEFRLAMHKLVVGSLPTDLEWTGVVAVDETAIDTYSRGKSEFHDPWDKDARWGYRTQTEHTGRKDVFGYQGTVISPVPMDGKAFPMLIADIFLTPANEDGVSETIDATDLLLESGLPITKLIADRGYSQKISANFATPLRKREIKIVVDLKITDQGAYIDPESGTLIIAGWPHCPATPEYLWNIVKPTYMTKNVIYPRMSAKRRKRAEEHNAQIDYFNELIAERQKYACVSFGTTAAGTRRFKCPGRAGKAVCANCPLSTMMAKDSDTAIVENPPCGKELPKCCTQETFTVSDAALGKMHQEHYWGSPEWQSDWSLRSRVEGMNSQLKESQLTGIRRGWMRVVGQIKCTLLVTLAAVALNVHRIRDWLITNGENLDSVINGIADSEPDTVISQANLPLLV